MQGERVTRREKGRADFFFRFLIDCQNRDFSFPVTLSKHANIS